MLELRQTAHWSIEIGDDDGRGTDRFHQTDTANHEWIATGGIAGFGDGGMSGGGMSGGGDCGGDGGEWWWWW